MFLDATDIALSNVFRSAHGAETVRVSGRTARRLVAGRFAPVHERTARRAPPSRRTHDSAAEAEFERLLASARPATTASPVMVVRAIAAGSRGSDGYPVGPVVLDIPPVYTSPNVFVLASTDGRERSPRTSAPRAEVAVRGGPTDLPLLSRDLRLATDADGQRVVFEPPRAAGGEQEPPERESTNAMRGEGPATMSDAPTGDVQGTPVRVHFNGPAASAEQARRLLAILNAAR